MAAWRSEILLFVREKNIFQHSKGNFISLCGHVSYIFYTQSLMMLSKCLVTYQIM